MNRKVLLGSKSEETIPCNHRLQGIVGTSIFVIQKLKLNMKKALLLLLTSILSLCASAQALTTDALSHRSGVEVVIRFNNPTGKTANFDMGVGVFHSEGYVEPLSVLTSTSGIAPGSMRNSQFFNLNGKLDNLPNGSIVVPISRFVNLYPWYIAKNPSEIHFQKIVRGNKAVLTTNAGIAVKYPLLAPHFENFEHSIKRGQNTNISLRVSNQGYARFHNTVYLLSSDPAHRVLGKKALALDVKAEENLSVSYSPSISGKVTLTLALDEAGTKVVAQQEITVEEKSNVGLVSYWTNEQVELDYDEEGVVETPEEAIAIRCKDKDIQIRPNTNPNTLYFLPADATIPESLAGHNVVLGNRAKNISIEDLHSFDTPLPFTAEHAVYRREVGKTTTGNGSNWQTIVLPFAVQQICVESDKHPITWRKQEGDEGHFWLREFNRVEGDVCYFSDAQSFASHTPYIVSFPGTAIQGRSLEGETLLWKADNVEFRVAKAEVIHGRFYFVGSLTGESVQYDYILNDAGNKFERQPRGYVPAQRASFYIATADQHPTQALNIAFDHRLTGLNTQWKESSVAPTMAYTLAGRPVGRVQQSNGKWQIDHLAPGVYLIAGQRIVR